MDRTWSVLMESGQMMRSAIAFVTIKAVLRILSMIIIHNSVAGDFGDNGGGSNRETLLVAFDNKLTMFWQ